MRHYICIHIKYKKNIIYHYVARARVYIKSYVFGLCRLIM